MSAPPRPRHLVQLGATGQHRVQSLDLKLSLCGHKHALRDEIQIKSLYRRDPQLNRSARPNVANEYGHGKTPELAHDAYTFSQDIIDDCLPEWYQTTKKDLHHIRFQSESYTMIDHSSTDPESSDFTLGTLARHKVNDLVRAIKEEQNRLSSIVVACGNGIVHTLNRFLSVSHNHPSYWPWMKEFNTKLANERRGALPVKFENGLFQLYPQWIEQAFSAFLDAREFITLVVGCQAHEKLASTRNAFWHCNVQKAQEETCKFFFYPPQTPDAALWRELLLAHDIKAVSTARALGERTVFAVDRLEEFVATCNLDKKQAEALNKFMKNRFSMIVDTDGTHK
ncbi:hypothetical protein BT63DRAFT_460092 [Microthyrium microscopicum]|uniref:Uncharacterized protein n=1 Tax=Microthyrium microscopicum TaxID=703497 RepID=A0A6A6TX13_9PEZI|nr:hypothetical protein BT63DRAFT_460092 [Microthyrium microscopicum]